MKEERNIQRYVTGLTESSRRRESSRVSNAFWKEEARRSRKQMKEERNVQRYVTGLTESS
ncbi:hypothetical protein D7Z54_34945 [Salibacterium salarium]|uniref:Uncharacterized protein n=1 Tax=Salibacterium salarium TaxID=284579 RepID=A0A428MRR3_9BACI|nr:hypothetical protein D7Z54_34945 [Salibacterium salarium]